MVIICPHCKKEVDLPTGQVNRSNKKKSPIYCGRVCSGLARRLNKSEEQKKNEKAEYDKKYREERKEIIRIKKQEYNKTPAGRATQKRNRDKLKDYHKQYCRQPEYCAKKKVYDQEHRAKKQFGEFWESGILLKELENNIDRHEANMSNNTFNKSQKRKQLWNQIQQHQFSLQRLT